MLEGPDVSVEMSLKGYGIAWKKGKTETRFYYGVRYTDEEGYTGFGWADIENNIDLDEEYDWADLVGAADLSGMSLQEWGEMPLGKKIGDLVDFYGTENTFGSIYTEPLTYEEVIDRQKGKTT